MNRSMRTPEAVQSRFAAVAYRAAELRDSHGLIPWRILPQPARDILLESSLDLSKPLFEVFAGVPETSGESGLSVARSSRLLTRLWNRLAIAPGHHPPRRVA